MVTEYCTFNILQIDGKSLTDKYITNSSLKSTPYFHSVSENLHELKVSGFRSYTESHLAVYWHSVSPQHYLQASVNK